MLSLPGSRTGFPGSDLQGYLSINVLLLYRFDFSYLEGAQIVIPTFWNNNNHNHDKVLVCKKSAAYKKAVQKDSAAVQMVVVWIPAAARHWEVCGECPDWQETILAYKVSHKCIFLPFLLPLLDANSLTSHFVMSLTSRSMRRERGPP